MNQDELKAYKDKLKKETEELENNLSQFAKKDPEIAGDWDAKFPSFGDVRSDQDENANKVEEYENRKGLEHELEKRLADINSALEKITAGSYGICEKCGKSVKKERLEVNPEARFCKKHMQ